MKNFVRCFEHDKFLLVIEGFDHLKDSSGTSKVVKSHELLFQEQGYDYVCIYPINLTYRIGMKMTGVYGLSVNGKPVGFTGLDNLKYCLAECERAGYGLAGILIHHAIFNDLEKLGNFLHEFPDVKKVFYLHDYWTCCLSITMMRDKTRNAWCHSDMKVGCNSCVWKERNDRHREGIKRFFDQVGACEFIAPSESVAREWRLRNPSGFSQVRVIEHLKPSSFGVRSQESSDDVVRVAFVGAPCVNKGWPEFEYLAKHCKGKVKLYHMGHTDLRLPGVENVDVQIHKQGLNAMVNALSDNKIDVSLLLSGWLETYSYTLFESLQAKSLVCCFEDSGNVADVIRKAGGGLVLQEQGGNARLPQFGVVPCASAREAANGVLPAGHGDKRRSGFVLRRQGLKRRRRGALGALQRAGRREDATDGGRHRMLQSVQGGCEGGVESS